MFRCSGRAHLIQEVLRKHVLPPCIQPRCIAMAEINDIGSVETTDFPIHRIIETRVCWRQVYEGLQIIESHVEAGVRVPLRQHFRRHAGPRVAAEAGRAARNGFEPTSDVRAARNTLHAVNIQVRRTSCATLRKCCTADHRRDSGRRTGYTRKSTKPAPAAPHAGRSLLHYEPRKTCFRGCLWCLTTSWRSQGREMDRQIDFAELKRSRRFAWSQDSSRDRSADS